MSIRYQIAVVFRMPTHLCRLLASTTAPVAILLWTLCIPASAQVFYTVESPGGQTGWLLGTIHTEDARVLDLPPVLRQALADADRLALELVPDTAMLKALNAAMVLPSDQRLSQLLDESLYAEVLAVLAPYGMTASAIERMRPWAVAMTLAQPPPETGLVMDMALAFRAARHGAEVVGLETLDEQLSFLTGLGREAHIEMLRLAVDDTRRGRTLFERLITTYLAHDAEGLRDLTESELGRMGPEFRSRFRQQGIIERNARMAERAAPLLDQGDTLVAVGALHLPGEAGVVARLRDMGYRLEALY